MAADIMVATLEYIFICDQANVWLRTFITVTLPGLTMSPIAPSSTEISQRVRGFQGQTGEYAAEGERL